MRRVLLIVGVLSISSLSLCVALSGGQTLPGSQTPGMPAQSPPPGGATTATTDATPTAGIIRGRVTMSGSARAIRSAGVRVTAAELPAPRTAITDAQGRYEIRNLPAGRYTVSATKPTFITLQRGQTRPFEAGKPLDLGERETIENVDFSLPRGGVMTGRVLDERGDPMVGLTVRAMRPRFGAGGRRDLTPIGTAVATNDLGVFRIFGLSPGEYYVYASLRYAIASDPAGVGFAATYYPGVADPLLAQRVSVGLGQTRQNVDLTLAPVRTATISGRVVDADGKLMTGGGINLQQRAPAPTEGIGFTQVRSDGRFTLANIPPGDYDLAYDAPSDINAPAWRGVGSQLSGVVARLIVTGSDQNDVVVALTRVSGGQGRLVLPPGAPSFNLSTVRLGAYPVDPYENRRFIFDATVRDDLTFDLLTPPGQMAVRAVALPLGWVVKEVRYGRKDVTDSGIAFIPGEQRTEIEVELTNRLPIISGSVRDVKGEPANDYAVILFPQDPGLRTANPRFYALARPDQSGRFRVATLAPGDYLAVALEYVDPNEAADPALLRRVEAGATRFSVGEGDARVLDLKVVVP